MAQATELDPRKRPRDRKDRIVAAAAARFGRAGFRATGLEDVAADVGVTAGAIYRHFESKEDILATAVARAADELLAASQAAVDGDGSDGEPSSDALRSLVSSTVAFAVEEPALFTAFVREGHRVTGRAATTTRRREFRVIELWRRAAQGSAVRLDDDRVNLRLRAVLAALREMVLSAEPDELQRHATLVTDAFLAVWTAPPSVLAQKPKPAPRSGFRPPALRSQQILDAALALFRERGFHDVGMEDIAASVGMVASGIYRFYPSKADILLDAYDLVVAHVITGIDEVLAEARDAKHALHGLIELQVRTALAVVDLITVTEREGSSLPEAERPRLARRRRQILEIHAAVLRSVRPGLSESEARVLLYGLQPLIRTAAATHASLQNPVEELAGMGLALLGVDRPARGRTPA